MPYVTGRKTGSSFPDLPKQQPYSYGRREDGRYAVVPYAGLDQGQIDSLALYVDSLGLNYSVQTNFGGRQELTIDYPWNYVNSAFAAASAEAIDIWEIVPQKTMVQLLQSQNPLVLQCYADTNGPAALLDLQKRVEQNTLTVGATDPTTGLVVRQTISGTALAYPNSAMQLFAALLQGVTSVEFPAPILTRVRTVTASYIDPANFANVGSIISTGTLISTEAIPSAVLFDFPTPSDPPPVPIGDGSLGIYQVYLYGWLKNAPSVRQITNQKWNLTQTWDFGLWLINLYGGTRL